MSTPPIRPPAAGGTVHGHMNRGPLEDALYKRKPRKEGNNSDEKLSDETAPDKEENTTTEEEKDRGSILDLRC